MTNTNRTARPALTQTKLMNCFWFMLTRNNRKPLAWSGLAIAMEILAKKSFKRQAMELREKAAECRDIADRWRVVAAKKAA